MPLTSNTTKIMFSALKPIVEMVERLDGFQINSAVLSGTTKGAMLTVFPAAFTILEPESVDRDQEARRILVDAYDSHWLSVNAWKQRFVDMTRLVLAGHMVDAENLPADDLDTLLTRLEEVMDDTLLTVPPSTPDVPTPSADAGNQGNMTMVSSERAATLDTGGAETSDQLEARVRANQLRIECVNNDREGAEVWTVDGNIPQGDMYDPYWENAGRAGSLITSSSVGDTLLANGGFETATSTQFSSWANTTGTWNTHIAQEGTIKFRGSYALKLSFTTAGPVSPKITQTLTEDSLRPHTKYLITFKARKGSGGGTGNLNVGFTGTAGHYKTVAVGDLTTGYVTYSYVFNTGKDPSAITAFVIEASRTAGDEDIYVDEVTLSEMKRFGYAGLAVICGSADPAVGDFFTCSATNGLSGKILTYFSRFFDLLLPVSSSPTIADP